MSKRGFVVFVLCLVFISLLSAGVLAQWDCPIELGCSASGIETGIEDPDYPGEYWCYDLCEGQNPACNVDTSPWYHCSEGEEGPSECTEGEKRCRSRSRPEICYHPDEGEPYWAPLPACTVNYCRYCNSIDGECTGDYVNLKYKEICKKPNAQYCKKEGGGKVYKCDNTCSAKLLYDCKGAGCNGNNCDDPSFWQRVRYNLKTTFWGSIFLPRQDDCFSYEGSVYQFLSQVPQYNHPLEAEFKINNPCVEPTDQNSFLIHFEDQEIENGMLGGCNIVELVSKEITINSSGRVYNLFCSSDGNCDVNLTIPSGTVDQDTILTIKKLQLSNCECGDILCTGNASIIEDIEKFNILNYIFEYAKKKITLTNLMLFTNKWIKPDLCKNINCNDNDLCTADTCNNGICYNEPIC